MNPDFRYNGFIDILLMVQGDQLYMAVCFCYLVKFDLSSVRYCTIAYTSSTYYKVPEQHEHVIWSGCIQVLWTVFNGIPVFNGVTVYCWKHYYCYCTLCTLQNNCTFGYKPYYMQIIGLSAIFIL